MSLIWFWSSSPATHFNDRRIPPRTCTAVGIIMSSSLMWFTAFTDDRYQIDTRCTTLCRLLRPRVTSRHDTLSRPIRVLLASPPRTHELCRTTRRTGWESCVWHVCGRVWVVICYCVLHVTWQTWNLHIILRAEIQNTISHPFLNGLLWNLVYRIAFTRSSCSSSLGA